MRECLVDPLIWCLLKRYLVNSVTDHVHILDSDGHYQERQGAVEGRDLLTSVEKHTEACENR